MNLRAATYHSEPEDYTTLKRRPSVFELFNKAVQYILVNLKTINCTWHWNRTLAEYVAVCQDSSDTGGRSVGSKVHKWLYEAQNGRKNQQKALCQNVSNPL